jgi:hypothetical protein
MFNAKYVEYAVQYMPQMFTLFHYQCPSMFYGVNILQIFS